MRARLVLLAVVALLVAAVPAWGQQEPTPTPSPTPSPTATPTPTPTPDPEEEEKAELRKRKSVKRVYRDFEDDGRIESCDHTKRALKLTKRSVSDEYDEENPDFKPALEAAIEDYDEAKERCEEEEREAEETPTPTPAPTPRPAPAPTPAPYSPPPADDDGGDVPELDLGGGGGGGGGGRRRDPDPVIPPSEGDVAPVQPSVTPSPTPAGPPETELVVTRPGDGADLLLPALLLAAALLGLALTGASALAARRGGRLAGWGHAWREATYRATGAWGDFGDWLRFGR